MGIFGVNLKKKIIDEANEYFNKVKSGHKLPQIKTSLILKEGEYAIYSSPTILKETRSVRHYSGGHAGFRIMNGVYIGKSAGKSENRQEWQEIERGIITITNKRLIFHGDRENVVIPIDKINNIDVSTRTVEISAENKKKNMLFEINNPMIFSALIQILNKVPDPNDLKDVDINITFE